MSKNPFSPNNSYENTPKRNNFDLSFTNNLTFNIGQLIPCYCQEVIPGDHFRISSAMGLRFMPLVFPVQCKMKAYIHFFYQRNKNLWKDWNDFIYYNKPNLVPPYVTPVGVTTGSLYDYMGLPTAIYDHTPVKAAYGLINPSVGLIP
ncbi:hypothetical protein [Peromfec virus RodF8_14]|uniref:Major capsid protein n=1 Tax=Peromfec virus RodF8_14 TaxID=2929359 RepID=A0A976N1W7_9VIRU|nr:hypothetical protein [Peromfec virus RodF8_14]